MNPALGELTADRLAVGYRLLHVGFLAAASDLSTGGLAYAGRRSFGGLSAGFTALDSPLWTESAGRAGCARGLGRGFSVGVGIGLVQRAFRLGRFVLADGDDPLLQGGLTTTVATLAAGVAWREPQLGLTVGAVLENPHEPDASVAGDGTDPLRRTWRLGAAWERPAYVVDAALARDERRTRWSAQGRALALDPLALGLQVTDADWGASARVAVTDALWVEYTVAFPRSDLAGAASGTHGLMVCWQKPGPLPRASAADAECRTQPRPPVQNPESRKPPAPRAGRAPAATADSAPDYRVTAPADTLRVRVKRLRRALRPTCRPGCSRACRAGRPGSSTPPGATASPGARWTPPRPPRRRRRAPVGDYSPAYQARARELADWLRRNPGEGVTVAAPADQLARARYLAERIARDAGREVGPGQGVEDRASYPGGRSPAALLRPVGRDSLPGRGRDHPARVRPGALRGDARHRGPAAPRAWSLEIRTPSRRTGAPLRGARRPARHRALGLARRRRAPRRRRTTTDTSGGGRETTARPTLWLRARCW